MLFRLMNDGLHIRLLQQHPIQNGNFTPMIQTYRNQEIHGIAINTHGIIKQMIRLFDLYFIRRNDFHRDASFLRFLWSSTTSCAGCLISNVLTDLV